MQLQEATGTAPNRTDANRPGCARDSAKNALNGSQEYAGVATGETTSEGSRRP